MKRRRDPFQAIADPTRRAILVLLATQTMTAGAIAGNFEAARPTISKHLQILNECELIDARQEGREIYYELKVENMKAIDRWLEQFRQLWEDRFNQLDDVLNHLKNQSDEQ
ncbi:MAG: winged helix-turn-helix transcriptional regulator [Lewinella sp.]|nr:winged helix-turn-helix transcriptional regulator [Lewinella sp.]